MLSRKYKLLFSVAQNLKPQPLLRENIACATVSPQLHTQCSHPALAELSWGLKIKFGGES